MIRTYKFHNTDWLYFVNFATVCWIGVFSQVTAAQPARQSCESEGKWRQFKRNAEYKILKSASDLAK